VTITSVRVRDLATIADATLELGPGLNVLTGETGAGKSMLIDALALLLGDRADRAAVRPDAGRAVVEAVIEQLTDATRRRLDQSGIDAADDTLIIRREVTSEGRSRAWINGSPTTVGVLATVGGTLVDLHGQHQTIQLLGADVQRDMLDTFAHAEPVRATVTAAHQAVLELQRERDALAARRDDAQRRADWLRHVVAEIDAARVRPAHDELIDDEAARLSQIGTLSEHAARVVAALDDEQGGARAALSRADRSLTALERADPVTGKWRELLDAAFASLSEFGRLAEDYLSGLAEDPDRLAELQQRRSLLDGLRRKHGATLHDVLATRTAAAAELDLLDSAQLDLAAMGNRIDAAQRALAVIAADLSSLRREAGDRLAREVTRLLPKLGLTGGSFAIDLSALPAVGPRGAEMIEFMVRLNRGIDARPLARVASGGELSRVMLALKVSLARQDAVPTLVFDEIDQGIGGEVGTRVAESLARVAERHQVLVITHLPQIAARADRHLRIAKATRGGIATSDVTVLHGEDRVLELARMLGDPDGDAARRLAQAMMAGIPS
jgi:DNA repair protein RecN (Recombination protein N)